MVKVIKHNINIVFITFKERIKKLRKGNYEVTF